MPSSMTFGGISTHGPNRCCSEAGICGTQIYGMTIVPVVENSGSLLVNVPFFVYGSINTSPLVKA